MVEFDLRINRKQQSVYFPDVLVEALGFNLKVLPNDSAAILYSEDADDEAVIKSVQPLLQGLQLKVESGRRQKMRKSL